MKQILLSIITLLLFSCKNDKDVTENIVGKWKTDSINFNGMTIKGDLIKNNMLWKMEFKTDSTYQIYQGNDTKKFSEGKWNSNNNNIETSDFRNDKMQCEFISKNAIKLTYQKNNDVGIMYMSRNDFITKNHTLKNETKNENAKISGIATYPSDGIPDYINVYAQDINSKKIYNHKIFDRKKGYFEIELSEGEYCIFSAENSNNFTKPNKKEIVKVVNGKNIENINAQDLYVSNFVPVQNTTNDSSILTLKLLEDLSDLQQINPNKVEKKLREFDESWIYKSEYSSKKEFFFGKQNEVIELYLKYVKYTFLDKNTFVEINEQLHKYVDLKLLKNENNVDYNKKYWQTPYNTILMVEVKKDNGKIFGYSILIYKK